MNQPVTWGPQLTALLDLAARHRAKTRAGAHFRCTAAQATLFQVLISVNWKAGKSRVSASR
jgi:hypothetical protein